MSKIESRIGVIREPEEKIYNFLADFNNFKDLLPEDRISGFESTEDSCSFTVEGMGRLGMKTIEKEPHQLIKIGSDEQSPIEFTLWIQLKQLEPGDSRMKITVEPKLNPMMAGMVKKPLKTFVDSLVERAEQISYEPRA
jgi:hypothetical protein